MKTPLKFAFEGRFFKYTFWNTWPCPLQAAIIVYFLVISICIFNA